MSKSNVNPNHYKVAGRERQGENIVQERHKQKHARSLTRARFEAKAARTRTALVPGPPPPAAPPKPAAQPDARPAAKQVAKATKQAAGKAKKATAGRAKKLTASRVGKQTADRARKQTAIMPDTSAQGSAKRGKRSTAQKRASARHDFGPMPATTPVAGAFGKEPSPRRRKLRQG